MEICEAIIYGEPIEVIDPETFKKTSIQNPVKRYLYMLDGRADEIKSFRAEAVVDGCKLKATVRAFSAEEARQMLDDLGMQDYVLVDNEEG